MSGHGVEAAYVTRPVSIAYLTGFHAEPHERLMALAVRPDGATLIVPALEAQKAEQRQDAASVVGWRDGEDAYRFVREALGSSAEIAAEKDHLTVEAAEILVSRTAARELVDVGPELRRMRLRKAEPEVEKLRRAAAITDEAGENVIARLGAGVSELEVAMWIAAAIAELGGELSFGSLVQSGPNSAMPHLTPTGRRLGDGDFVLLDFGAAFDNYKADTTRMAFIGTPSARHREVHDAVLRGHDAAIAAVRPGATTGDVDAAARRVIDDAGYGERFFHRVGHGLGLEAHEAPSLDPGSSTVLEPGMVFTVEPGVYIPDWGGVRIEDDVVVTEDGCDVLTRSDPSLRLVGGR